MLEILKLFYQICLFQKGPQDVPYSPLLTKLVVLSYAVISFLLLNMSNLRVIAALQVLVDIVLTISFTLIVLLWVGKLARFQQTLCALFGTDSLLNFFSIPAFATIIIPETISDISILAFFAIVGLMIWHWAIMGNILRHALEQNLGFALGLALLYVMGFYQLMSFLFPEAH